MKMVSVTTNIVASLSPYSKFQVSSRERLYYCACLYFHVSLTARLNFSMFCKAWVTGTSPLRIFNLLSEWSKWIKVDVQARNIFMLTILLKDIVIRKKRVDWKYLNSSYISKWQSKLRRLVLASKWVYCVIELINPSKTHIADSAKEQTLLHCTNLSITSGDIKLSIINLLFLHKTNARVAFDILNYSGLNKEKLFKVEEENFVKTWSLQSVLNDFYILTIQM